MKRSIINMFVVMAAVLQLVTLNSCSPEAPEEKPQGGALPTVSPYNVFGFKEDSYAENLWAYNYNDGYGYLIWNDASARLKYDYLSGEKMYLRLHNNLYFCKNTEMQHNAVVLKEKEEGHDVDKWYYDDDDVLDYHPFSAFYRIPGKVLGINDVPEQEQTLRQSLVPRINALIDSGDIEQYRVDLGY